MQLQTGRFGKYFLCQNDNCGATRQLMRNGEPKPIVMDPINTNIACEKVEDIFLLRDSYLLGGICLRPFHMQCLYLLDP